MAFVDQFGGKSAGELIRAELWNNVMAALDELAASVDSRFETVTTSLTAIGERVTALSGTVERLETDVGTFEGLLTQYFKVSLSTTRLTFATGEEATIVAEVRDLQGNPIAFAPNDRPWIDFVTVWGHL